jgi:hypothetical protein
MTVTTEVPTPPQAVEAQARGTSCVICGLPSTTAECLACFIAADAAFERAADR